MRFYDEVKVFVRSGAGGKGCVGFRREKYIPRGGPDGGDGGDGGNVLFVADAHRKNLISLAYQKQYRAKAGGGGQGSNRHGRNGEDRIVSVPVGTLVYDIETGDLLADLTKEGQTWIAARGGLGGKGNARFASSTNRAPRKSTPGQPQQERWLRVELKLMAQVGLLGFPSAGKSTFVAAISSARPKIGDYPFTTLAPQLGTVEFDDAKQMIVADIPGIIDGAAQGAGLGLRFLRHIERNNLLLHLLDLSQDTQRDPADDFHKLNAELAAYGKNLPEKPQIVVANKMDLPEAEERLKQLKKDLGDQVEIHSISALAGIGVAELLTKIRLELEEMEVLKVETEPSVSDE